MTTVKIIEKAKIKNIHKIKRLLTCILLISAIGNLCGCSNVVINTNNKTKIPDIKLNNEVNIHKINNSTTDENSNYGKDTIKVESYTHYDSGISATSTNLAEQYDYKGITYTQPSDDSGLDTREDTNLDVSKEIAEKSNLTEVENLENDSSLMHESESYSNELIVEEYDDIEYLLNKYGELDISNIDSLIDQYYDLNGNVIYIPILDETEDQTRNRVDETLKELTYIRDLLNNDKYNLGNSDLNNDSNDDASQKSEYVIDNVTDIYNNLVAISMYNSEHTNINGCIKQIKGRLEQIENCDSIIVSLYENNDDIIDAWDKLKNKLIDLRIYFTNIDYSNIDLTMISRYEEDIGKDIENINSNILDISINNSQIGGEY